MTNKKFSSRSHRVTRLCTHPPVRLAALPTFFVMSGFSLGELLWKFICLPNYGKPSHHAIKIILNIMTVTISTLLTSAPTFMGSRRSATGDARNALGDRRSLSHDANDSVAERNANFPRVGSLMRVACLQAGHRQTLVRRGHRFVRCGAELVCRAPALFRHGDNLFYGGEVFSAAKKPFSVTQKSLSVTNQHFSLADRGKSVSDQSFSVADPSPSAPDQALSMPDNTLSVADQHLSTPKNRTSAPKTPFLVIQPGISGATPPWPHPSLPTITWLKFLSLGTARTLRDSPCAGTLPA